MDGKKIKICLVGSSGGHLTHLYKMLEDGTYKGDLFSDL